MEGMPLEGRAYVLGSRIPSLVSRDTMAPGSILQVDSNVPVVARSDSESCTDPNLCQKPGASQNLTLPITIPLVVVAVGVVIALWFMHRKNLQRQRREDAMDPHKSMDFGLGEDGKMSKNRDGKEKDPRSHYARQMSMDMNLSSPYLLPPNLHQSRESLHSLARTLHSNEDPYRHVAQFTGSDAGSIRSLPRGRDGSVYGEGNKSNRNSRSSAPYSHGNPPSRQNSMPTSPLAPPEAAHMRASPNMSDKLHSTSPPPVNPFVSKTEPIVSQLVSIPYSETKVVEAPVMQEPPVSKKVVRKPSLPSPGEPSPADSGVAIGFGEDSYEMMPKRTPAVGLGLSPLAEPQQAEIHNVGIALSPPSSPPPAHTLPAHPRPLRTQEPALQMPVVEEPTVMHAQMPAMPEEPYEERGRNMQRNSHLYRQSRGADGLGVPQQDNKRLSVGFRPLPPSDVMDSEDPEYRANRIRSFYKEYFDDSKPTEPMPPMPHQYVGHNNAQQNHGNAHAQYYEDYDQGYMGDTAYFDPESNSFVMPYAQPVARRAMTPPPTGQRFPGPRGPGPRGPPRGPPRFSGGPGSRPGSATSSRLGPRPGSSASNAYNRPRAGSTMSGGRFGGPRKPMPPPADLSTLPTPSKLKDDSFALFNAMDFAPPETFAERARGRSQSPLGERKAYKMNVPVHSPLVNAFEELPSLPSPHLMQKNGTFTNLDFAPPRKFMDNDTRSETGSIRSNRSGVSAAQLSAIRGGAGRVSRLPGDTIFTQVDMGQKLKPQWGMRD